MEYNKDAKYVNSEREVSKPLTIKSRVGKKDPTGFLERIKPLKAYYYVNGSISDIKHGQICRYEGRRWHIGQLVEELRCEYDKNKLTDAQIGVLEYMGISWQTSYDDCFKLLQQWVATTHKGLNEVDKNDNMLVDGKIVNVRNVLNRVRLAKRNGKLKEQEIIMLEDMGIEWEYANREVIYASLALYAEEYGSITSIITRTRYACCGKIYDVGAQVIKLRQHYRNKNLTQQEIDYFNKLGMLWNVSTKILNYKQEETDLCL